MRLDVALDISSLKDVPAQAQAAEKLGFDALWVPETNHDPFLALALAAEHTNTIKIGTAIAVAFPRSPMVLAYTNWDLQALSAGRMMLGLGTQVKGHIERRFGMVWESPAEKLKEVIQSLRTIWDCWQNDTKLRYTGKFYNFSLMTPFFNPGPIDYPRIPIFISAVNKHVCQLVGEICDGIHIHPLHTPRYIREVIIPNIEIGATRAGRSPQSVQRSATVFAALGRTEDEINSMREVIRAQISFYASTRTYKPVLDLHGWGDLCESLGAKAARGEWHLMPAEIPDAMLDEFTVSAPYTEVAEHLKAKYDGLLDRLTLYIPFNRDLYYWPELSRTFKS
ncbi:MAG: TIGR03617 family F420-dependent LLM class oxidoreductase [Acidobacteria bacterium]|nr:TIGR03617 family F420-dependent LLM class oxidoreductase [Acidobacteriota bacterium]